MVNFRAALERVASKILPAPRSDSFPSPMRNVAADSFACNVHPNCLCYCVKRSDYQKVKENSDQAMAI